MKIERKLVIAVLTIIAFTVILIAKPDYDPLSLGAGFSAFLAPILYGFGAEYKNKNKAA